MIFFDCNLTYFDTAASLNGFSHIWSESIKMTKSGKRWDQSWCISEPGRVHSPWAPRSLKKKKHFSMARTPTLGMDHSKTWYVSVTLLVIRAKFSEMVAAAIRAPLTRIWVESTFWMKCTFVLFASQALHWNVSQCQYVVNIMSSFTQWFRQMFNLLCF